MKQCSQIDIKKKISLGHPISCSKKYQIMRVLFVFLISQNMLKYVHKIENM